MNSKTIICGDVHGCLEELDELLLTIQYKHNADILIFVGDLIDRGPDSIGVVRRAKELNAVSVIGNHEHKYLRYRQQKAEGNVRIQMNEHKLAINEGISDSLWNWIASWPSFIRLTDNLVIVHAGLRRGISIENQEKRVLYMMRYAMRDDGRMAGMKLKGDDFLRPSTAAFWTELWDGKESVIYGHHVQRDGVAIDTCVSGAFCFGLDTGACFGRSLSTAVFEDNDYSKKPVFVSVDAKTVHAKQFNDGTYDED